MFAEHKGTSPECKLFKQLYFLHHLSPHLLLPPSALNGPAVMRVAHAAALLLGLSLFCSAMAATSNFEKCLRAGADSVARSYSTSVRYVDPWYVATVQLLAQISLKTAGWEGVLLREARWLTSCKCFCDSWLRRAKNADPDYKDHRDEGVKILDKRMTGFSNLVENPPTMLSVDTAEDTNDDCTQVSRPRVAV